MELTPLGGQLRIDGILVGPLDSTKKSFSVLVYAVTMPNGRREWLDPPRRKTVNIRIFSQFSLFGNPTSAFGLFDTSRQHYHVVVLGSDDGSGTPLTAHNVWVTQEGPAQVAYVAGLTSRAGRSRSARHMDPEVESSSETVMANGNRVELYVVRVRLSTVRIKVGLANGELGQIEPLESIASRYGAIAAINGSFFDADDPGPEHMPDMPLVTSGLVLGRSYLGTLLGFCSNGEARMEPAMVALSLHDRNPDMPVDLDDPDHGLFWERVEEGVGCGPRLVRDGEVKIDPYSEGITSDEVLSGTAIRSAVGLTRDGWMLLVVSHPTTLADLAEAMRRLGAYQAMNLDGGSSSGLIVRGHSLLTPGRWLSNAIVVLKR